MLANGFFYLCFCVSDQKKYRMYSTYEFWKFDSELTQVLHRHCSIYFSSGTPELHYWFKSYLNDIHVLVLILIYMEDTFSPFFICKNTLTWLQISIPRPSYTTRSVKKVENWTTVYAFYMTYISQWTFIHVITVCIITPMPSCRNKNEGSNTKKP